MLSQTRRSVPVGRDAELREIENFLDAVTSSHAVLALEGEAGIGKTTLWRFAAERARERGFRVLAAEPAEAEAQMSYSALVDLLGEAADTVLPALPPPQVRALRVALLLDEGAVETPGSHLVAMAALTALRVLAGRGPVVVAVDDLQWLDPSSARALAFAARRLSAERIGLLLSSRGDPTSLRLVDRGSSPVRRLELGPLSLGALQRVLHRELGQPLSRSILRRVHEASGGNPFFALELALAAQRAPAPLAPSEPLPVSGDLLALVAERLKTVAPRLREILAVIAALSDPTLDVVRAATGAGEEEFDEAIAAGLIRREGERLRFVHPLLASGIDAGLSAHRRRAIHRRLAAFVRDPEQRAWHLALASAEPDARSAAALDEAAEQARSRGAPAAAARFGEQAASLTPPGEEAKIWARKTNAARDYLLAGELERAAGLLREAANQMPSGVSRADVLVRLAWTALYRGDFKTANIALPRALAEGSGEPALEAEIEGALAWTRHVAGDLVSAEAHAVRALELAERSSDAGTLAVALADHAFIWALRGHGVDHALLTRALELESSADPSRILGRPSWLLSLVLAWKGELASARRRLETLHREAIEQGDEHSLPFVLTWLSRVDLQRGQWDSAARWADEAVEAALLTEQEGELVFALSSQAAVAAHRGDSGGVASAVEQGLPIAERMGVVPAIVEFQATRGFFELSRGRLRAAERHLAPLPATVDAAGLLEPAIFRFHADAVETLLLLDRVQEAEGLVETLRECSRSLASAWSRVALERCSGLLEARRGGAVRAAEVLAAASRGAAPDDEPFERARTLLALGATERRLKRKGAARTSLEAALASFERLGAPLWAERARSELSRIPSRRRQHEPGLTATQRRIAALVAEGRSNKEVAAELFVTVRTVEANLSRVYAKLGIRSRTQLARCLARDKP